MERDAGGDCEEKLAEYNMVTPASLVREMTQNPWAAITRGVNLPARKRKREDDDDDEDDESQGPYAYFEEDNYYGEELDEDKRDPWKRIDNRLMPFKFEMFGMDVEMDQKKRA